MDFHDQDLDIFHKGNYVPIDDSFISEAVKLMQPLYEIQTRYQKNDTDTFINEVRDSLVGRYLGYELINEKSMALTAKNQ